MLGDVFFRFCWYEGAGKPYNVYYIHPARFCVGGSLYRVFYVEHGIKVCVGGWLPYAGSADIVRV